MKSKTYCRTPDINVKYVKPDKDKINHILSSLTKIVNHQENYSRIELIIELTKIIVKNKE